jgi:hypothetical protein
MRTTDPKMGLGEWLEEAWANAPDCPTIETLAEAAQEGLAPEERARLDAHLASCPACAAEWRLARAFAAEEEVVAGEREDIDHVVARLADRFGRGPTTAAASEEREPGVLSFPNRRLQRSRISTWSRIAAVLILVVGIGAVLRNSGGEAPPTLPPLAPQDAVRSSAIHGLQPSGDVGSAPERLSWEPSAGALGYRVRLEAVDRTVLVDELVESPSVSLPTTVRDGLRPLAVYHWQVEALDARGERIAWSERASFRIAGNPSSDGQ